MRRGRPGPRGLQCPAVLIRHADPTRDAPACAVIYGPSVSDGVASLEDQAPGPEEMAQRIQATTHEWPWLVAEIDDAVAGYAYATRHRVRAAYRWSTDVSVYIDAAHHRRGIGRALYEALFGLLVEQGFYEACAGITLPNDASVGLHESLGFVAVGVYRGVGFKHGRWRDVGWWQKTLRERVPGQPPAEPRTPPAISG